jgi:hypothetical protein
MEPPSFSPGLRRKAPVPSQGGRELRSACRRGPDGDDGIPDPAANPVGEEGCVARRATSGGREMTSIAPHTCEQSLRCHSVDQTCPTPCHSAADDAWGVIRAQSLIVGHVSGRVGRPLVPRPTRPPPRSSADPRSAPVHSPPGRHGRVAPRWGHWTMRWARKAVTCESDGALFRPAEGRSATDDPATSCTRTYVPGTRQCRSDRTGRQSAIAAPADGAARIASPSYASSPQDPGLSTGGVAGHVPMTAGRCHPCHRHDVRSMATPRRGETRCPRCPRPLTRAGQPVGDALIARSVTEVRQAPASSAVADRTVAGGGHDHDGPSAILPIPCP